MKNSGNKRMIKRKGKLKRTPGEALQWLDEALKWYNWNNLELPKEKMNNLEPRIWYHERTPKEGINHLEETRIRITLRVSFTNLDWWQATDLCILLILVERIKIDIAQTWEGLHRTIGRIGKNEWIDMITKEKVSEGTTIRIRKWMTKENESP